jgi:alpha-mannosidase
LNVGPRHIENAFLRAVLADDGTIASLVHKSSGREALAGPGNQLWAYPQDKPRDWDAWDIEEDYAERGERFGAPERIEAIPENEHGAALRIVRRYRDSSIVQTLRLAANSRRLDIATQIDWRERRVLLRTLSPAAVRAERATFECAYGVIERPTHANTSWDAAMFEAVAHRFVDLSEPGFGLALLNDSKYGHSVRRNVLGLSLLRSPAYPDPLADDGSHAFVYSLMPHSGDWRTGGVREEADDLNQPLLTIRAENLAPGTLTPIKPSGVAAGLSALKGAEDGRGVLLRVYEPNGARGAFGLTLPQGWRVGEALSLLEEPLERTESAALRPFEVRSLRLTKV